MEFYCTICCKMKRRARHPLPAVERYISRRISHVNRLSQKADSPFLILSGEYGLLEPGEMIPWYDKLLLAHEVPGMAETVASQLRRRGVGVIRFHALPKTAPGWAPYYMLMEEACSRAGVELSVTVLDDSFI